MNELTNNIDETYLSCIANEDKFLCALRSMYADWQKQFDINVKCSTLCKLICENNIRNGKRKRQAPEGGYKKRGGHMEVEGEI